MGMYIEEKKLDLLHSRIKQVTEKAVKGASDVMLQEAYKIRDMAILMAPIKHGTLENAIEAFPEKGERNRKEIVIMVNGDDVGPTGVKVSEYAERMEKGPYNLGKRSEEKNEGTLTSLGAFGKRGGLKLNADTTGTGGLAVGPNFLKRALRRGIPRMSQRIALKAKDAIKKALR
jgi:hypothetical protein